MRENNLIGLMIVLAPLSLASVGGATAIYAPLQHEAVELRQWVTPQEFLNYFTIMRFMPGPSSMLGALIGWKLEGFWGVLVATLSLYAPSSLVCFIVARSWSRFAGKPWHTAMQRGLMPVATGLVSAGVWNLFQLSGGSLPYAAMMIGVAIALTKSKKLHPTPLLIAGALVFEGLYLVDLL
jgi:chromate transporter